MAFCLSLNGIAQTDSCLHAHYAWLYGYPDSVFSYIPVAPENSEEAELYGKAYFDLHDYNKAKLYFLQSASAESYYYLSRIYAIEDYADSAVYYLQKHLQTPYKKSYSIIITTQEYSTIEKSEAWRAVWKQDFYSDTDTEIAAIEYVLREKSPHDALEYITELKSTHSYYNSYKALAYTLNSEVKKSYSLLRTLPAARNDAERNIRYEAYTLMGKHELALQEIKNMQQPDVSTTLKKAQSCYAMQLYAEAEEYVEYVVQYDYKNHEAWFLLSALRELKKDYLLALMAINRAVEYAPQSADYLFSRALLYTELKQFKMAEIDYNQTLDLNPQRDVYFNRAQVRRYLGNMQTACYDYSRAYKLGNQEALFYVKKYCK